MDTRTRDAIDLSLRARFDALKSYAAMDHNDPDARTFWFGEIAWRSLFGGVR